MNGNLLCGVPSRDPDISEGRIEYYGRGGVLSQDPGATQLSPVYTVRVRDVCSMLLPLTSWASVAVSCTSPSVYNRRYTLSDKSFMG